MQNPPLYYPLVIREAKLIVFTSDREEEGEMPHRTRPMTSLLVFMGVNLVLVNTISPVYDFVCFLPYWERRREHRQKERENALIKGSEAN
ncbi:uncharacterized protein [Typha angustifolia]|uniref:uncharacterized protein isoform X3 n=1 Tax=Typha angustifolia TaxID=59011 RepID=UPI003C305842